MKLQNKMKCIILDGKAGFRNQTGGPVVILDEFQNPFYDTRVLNKKVWEFNLPSGVYYVQEGKFVRTPRAVEYQLEKLPPKERYIRSDPEQFPIIYTDNKYTASVYWDAERSPYGKSVIVFDKSMRAAPIPDFTFILYHEFAHRFYETERYCDMWASNRMLIEGFNPSQIGNAIVHTLSDNNMYRKDEMISSLQGK